MSTIKLILDYIFPKKAKELPPGTYEVGPLETSVERLPNGVDVVTFTYKDVRKVDVDD